MIGILCEKPSAAKNFAKALGGKSGTFEGQEYVICTSHGHLYELAGPEEQVPGNVAEYYKSWSLEHLPWNASDFSWKKKLKKDAAATMRQIKETLKPCSEIVIATDVDPSGEGQLLAWEIIDGANLHSKKITRMYFDDESPKQIQKAFLERKRLPAMEEDPEYRKAHYRERWDFLSMQWTRITTKYGSQMGAGFQVIREGRLKSAMIQLVGDQLKAVQSYEKIPYYQNRFRDENGNVYTDPKEPQFPSKEEVPKKYEDSPVVLDSVEKKTSPPPKLIDLAKLSSLLAGRGFRAKQILDTYQKMYEDQVVSYPRTEDKVITPEQFAELLPKANKIATLVGVDPALLTHRTPRPTHIKAGGAHGANRPGPNVPSSLDSLKEKYGPAAPAIYKLLAQSYLAMLGEDYEYEQQKGHVEKYPSFKATVNIPKKPGFKLILGNLSEEEEENGKAIGKNASPFVYEGFPPKPQEPTMKWLMTQLEKYDVGTGATRTSTYAEVTSEKAKYPLMKDTKGKLSMVTCGELSYRLLPNTIIGDLKITEKMQTEMKAVEKHQADPEELLKQIAQYIEQDSKVILSNFQKGKGNLPSKDAPSFEKKEKVTGLWKGKEISFSKKWGDHTFTEKEIESLLAGEEIEIRGLKSAKGTTYGITGKLTNQTYKGKKFVGFERTGFLSKEELER